jgi:glycerate kinase
VSEAVSLVELAGSVTAALDDPSTWLVEAGSIMAQRLTRR